MEQDLRLFVSKITIITLSIAVLVVVAIIIVKEVNGTQVDVWIWESESYLRESHLTVWDVVILAAVLIMGWGMIPRVHVMGAEGDFTDCRTGIYMGHVEDDDNFLVHTSKGSFYFNRSRFRTLSMRRKGIITIEGDVWKRREDGVLELQSREVMELESSKMKNRKIAYLEKRLLEMELEKEDRKPPKKYREKKDEPRSDNQNGK